MKGSIARASVLVCLSAGALLSLGASPGCQPHNFVGKLTITPSQNLEILRVALQLNPMVNVDVGGIFPIENYGSVFLNPSQGGSPPTPFEVGFNLRTSVVNEQKYLQLAPTEVLPNGMPIGIGRPVVQVQPEAPVNSKFDLVGYVDVLQGHWLGAGVTFSKAAQMPIPVGVAVQSVLRRDSDGVPTVVANVFGPIESDQNDKPGGAAIFIDIQEVLSVKAIREGKTLSLPLEFFSLPVAESKRP